MASAAPLSTETRSVLYGISWRIYEELRETPENYHVRMAYNRGTLETFLPSCQHHHISAIISRIVATWVDEMNIHVVSMGNTTWKREDLAMGLEPDSSYYVQNEPRMWTRMEIDCAVDPPFDLAVEVELSRSSVKKMPIYAALGIRELWRYDGQILRIYELVDGQYQSREASICFPNFPVAKAEEILQQVGEVRETTLMRGFRQWVRERFGNEGT